MMRKSTLLQSGTAGPPASYLIDIATVTSHPSIPISLVHSAYQEDPIARAAEQQAVDAPDALVETGALQRGNLMDIEALLNLH